MSSTDRSMFNFATCVITVLRVFQEFPDDCLLADDSPGCYRCRRDDNTYRLDLQLISASTISITVVSSLRWRFGDSSGQYHVVVESSSPSYQ